MRTYLKSHKRFFFLTQSSQLAPVSGAQRRQHWIRGEEGAFTLLSSSQKALEVGGSQLQGNGGGGGENIFFLPFTFLKKCKSLEQMILVSYLKPFSFGLGEV